MDNHYGGVIWTNHALERMSERGIKQGDAWATFSNPQKSRYAKTRGAWVYYRDWENWRIEVVAKQNERKEWVILSVWSSSIGRDGAAITGKSLLVKLIHFLLGRTGNR